MTRNEVEDWIWVGTICAAGLLQVLSLHLWSASRILNKLHRRQKFPRFYGFDPASQSFPNNYISFSKGNQYLLGRLSGILFFVTMDLFDAITITKYYEAVIRSEALVALRVMVYFGSLRVLLALTLLWYHYILFGLLLCFHISASLFLPHWLPTQIEPTLRAVRFHLILINIALFVCQSTADIVFAVRASGCLISDFAHKTMTGMELTASQMKFLQDIQKQKSPKRFWPLRWRDMGALGQTVISIFLTIFNAFGKSDRPLIIIEALMDAAAVLLFLNDTQVESRLFWEFVHLRDGLEEYDLDVQAIV